MMKKYLLIAALVLFHWTSPASAQFVLEKPAEGHAFGQSDRIHFTWDHTSGLTEGRIDYTVRVVRVLAGQTPLQALLENDSWYEVSAWANAKPTNGIALTLQKDFTPEEASKVFAWEVRAFGDFGTHVSDARSFVSRRLVEQVYARDYVVTIDPLDNHDVSSLSGTGTVGWPARSDIQPVYFEKIQVKHRWDHDVLIGGAFIADVERVTEYPVLEGIEGLFRSSIHQVRFGTQGPMLHGKFVWLPTPDLAIACVESVLRDDNEPGNPSEGCELSQEYPTPIPALSVALGVDDYLLISAAGARLRYEAEYQSTAGPDLNVSFASQKPFAYVEGVKPASASLRPVASNEIVLSAKLITADMDSTRSFPATGKDPDWMGLQLAELSLSLAPGSKKVLGKSKAPTAPVDGEFWWESDGLSGSLTGSDLKLASSVFSQAATITQIELEVAGDETTGMLIGTLSPAHRGKDEPLTFSFALTAGGTADTAQVEGLIPDEVVELGAATKQLFSLAIDGVTSELDHEAKTITLDATPSELTQVTLLFTALAASVQLDGKAIVNGETVVALSADSKLTLIAHDGTKRGYAFDLEAEEEEATSGSGGNASEPDAAPTRILEAPQLLSPADGKALEGTSAQLTWKPGNGTKTTAKYSVYLCTDADFEGSCEEPVCNVAQSSTLPPSAPARRWRILPVTPLPWAFALIAALGIFAALTFARLGSKSAFHRRLVVLASAGLCLGLSSCGTSDEPPSEIKAAGELSCSVKDLKDDQRYYWKVEITQEGESRESSVWSFDTE